MAKKKHLKVGDWVTWTETGTGWMRHEIRYGKVLEIRADDIVKVDEKIHDGRPYTFPHPGLVSCKYLVPVLDEELAMMALAGVKLS